MSSIDFIEISIDKINESIYIKIDVKNNLVTTNKKEKNISNLKIESLLRIIRTWKDLYEEDNIDSEKTMIRIKGKDYVDVIKCNGAYPRNYNLFKDWVGDIYE